MKPGLHTLVNALALRAGALAKRRNARLVAQARADLVVATRADAAAFYARGEALRRLAERDVLLALGHASFDALLRERVGGMSRARADRLMRIVEHVDPADAARWRQDKSFAVASLRRLPGVAPRADGRLRLPSGRVIDVERAATSTLARAASHARHALQEPARRGRGRTSTPDERATADALARALGTLGIEASAACVATKPGRPSDVQVRFAVASVPALLARLRPRR